MKPARLIVLSVALFAAVAAGYLAWSFSQKTTKTAAPAVVVKPVPTDRVLVARTSLPIGSRLNEENLAWQEWPEGAVIDGFITQSTRPDAVEEMNGSIVRLPIFEGEPLRNEKVVDSGTRIMSSILPAGKRAVSTEISVETGAGGFILPNDRVDVIMVRGSDNGTFITETVLSNIRVLAIDQRIEEDEEGRKTAVGTTATLELTPEQARIISVAQQMASRLTLALRSVADVQEPDTGGADHLLSRDGGPSIQLIRSGSITNIGAVKQTGEMTVRILTDFTDPFLTRRRLVRATAAAVLAVTGFATIPAAPAFAAESDFVTIRKSGINTTRRIELGLNKAVVVDLPEDAHDILVADPEVADAVTRSARRIYLFGKAVGQTNVFVFGADGSQIVSLDLAIERDITGLEQQIKRFIPDSDITIEIISDNIVLTGRVRTPQDASRASQLAEIFLKGGEATTRNITAVGGAGEGGAAIFAEQRQVSQIINLLDIDGEDQVTLKVTVAEVSRQVLKQLGFNSYLNSGSASFQSVNPVGLGKALSSTAAAISGNIGGVDISAYVRAMEQAGVMKTLAEPSLTAISGEAADFFVGGEFWRVDSQDVDEDGNVVYGYDEIEYGIGLEFTPVVLSAGRISLKVRTEVSEPTFEGSVSLSGAGTAGGISANGIRRREASTAVELPSGGSIVIAGLVRDDIRQVMGGLPGASKIPVLGTLFRSRDFVRNETELVIIATPYLVRPVARSALARPDDNFNAAGDGPANFLGRVNRIYGRMETDLPNGRYHGVVGFIYK